jgi:hypothetical protein
MFPSKNNISLPLHQKNNIFRPLSTQHTSSYVSIKKQYKPPPPHNNTPHPMFPSKNNISLPLHTTTHLIPCFHLG